MALLHASRLGGGGWGNLPYQTVVAAGPRFDVREGVIERLGQQLITDIERDGSGFVGEPESGGYQVTRDGLRERLATDMPAEVL